MSARTFRAKFAEASISKLVKQCCADESGATSIEYGLIAALISVMVVSGATLLGGDISQKFTDIALLMSGPPELSSAGDQPG